MRLYGSENLKNYIRGHIKLAEYFEQLLNGDPRFKVSHFPDLLVEFVRTKLLSFLVMLKYIRWYKAVDHEH